MAQRMQSPSSINLYKQCPRKYYYRYIARLPSKPSIHLVRGTVAHEVLEHFFSDFPERLDDWRTDCNRHALSLLEKYWGAHENEFSRLDETPEELSGYKDETRLMIVRWVQHFIERMDSLLTEGLSFEESFTLLTPKREEEYRDDELQVRGYIDAIERERDGNEVLMDYKTSKKPEITSEYRLQLGIYALLYLRRHQRLPKQVGIHFLRHDRQLMDVNDELLLDAQFEIEQVHMMTQSDSVADYPKQESPLCNWCDYYDVCFAKHR